MSDTTTVRVARATRDHLNKVSAETGQTVDATIQRALELREREQWRRAAELDAWAASQDKEDQAELREAMADLAHFPAAGRTAGNRTNARPM